MQSKRESVIPDGISRRRSDDSLINFPEALRNAEAERLSTINALLINLIIFSLHLARRVCVHWYFTVQNRDQI